MSIGIVGRKCGMSRIFKEDGTMVPVTIIEAEPNRVTQLKTMDNDGYRAVQVTTGTRRANRITKPIAGHLKKAEVEPGRNFWEFRLETQEQDIAVGSEIKVDIFNEGQYVDVCGVTKGKGFAGVIKRHNFSMQDATHGNSRSHRASGSIGQNQSPGRVFKNKRMAGQMGNVQRTAQNLEIVRIDKDKNLLLVKGSIPGAPGGDVIVRPTVKNN
jgi:large subunit ribosomal protein L3